MPGDITFRAGIGGLVSCDRFFETALANEIPWADLMMNNSFEKEYVRCLR